MDIITSKTPGVKPCHGIDFTGEIIVLAATDGRLSHPKYQLAEATGGSGCRPGAIGTGVFVRHLFIEQPEGSGRFVPNVKKKGGSMLDEAPGEYKAHSGDVIGIASKELIERVKADPTHGKPADPDHFVVLAQANMSWAKAASVKEALKMLGVKSYKKVSLCVVHRDCGVDFMSLHTPGYAIREGRPNVRWINDLKLIPATLKDAEEMAARFIAEARAHKGKLKTQA